jgi:NADH:ubiquinone oxidoreductase subunit D
MSEKRKHLEESARIMRQRLTELERRPVAEHERPIRQVALEAIRATLTEIGQQLNRLALAY